ncbi:MAG: TIGR03936 family radical SAM-associated protein [Acidimicrobiales bacterium]
MSLSSATVGAAESPGAAPLATAGDAPPPAPTHERIRLRYAKVGKIRFTSHRDVARMWERALRRSGLPVAWSEGFSPHPLLSFGLALPTGCESLAEYLDVRLDPPEGPGRRPGEDPAPAELAAILTELLPEGIEVQALGSVPGGAGSLQQEVTSCNWELEVLGVAAKELATRIGRLLDAPSVVIRRQRKGRQVEDDLRPSVLALAPIEAVARPGATGVAALGLRAELATHPRGVRPGELLEGLGTDLVLVRACRTHQWIERDGARTEPLASSGTEPGNGAPHAQERAS